MDPLTQGTLGVSLAQSFARSKGFRAAAFAGLIGGLLPDVDVFLVSAEDPLMFLDYHRHFTHSLAFIPVGGFIAAIFPWLLLRRHLSFPLFYLFATLGYATHGLLDACTSYGTHLPWPFSDARIAWSCVSIIDPLFTLPLLFMIIVGFIKKKALWGRTAIAYALCYLAFGLFQHGRAERECEKIALERGHAVQRMSVHPSFGNTVLWRTLYESEGMLYADAVRVLPWGSKPLVYEGESMPKFIPADNSIGLAEGSVAYNDIGRFQHFSDDWLVLLKEDSPYVIGDGRYSRMPHKLKSLWGIEVDPSKSDKHVRYITMRKSGDEESVKGDLGRLWRMIVGE